MTITGQNETEEIERLERITGEMISAGGVQLRLIYPSPQRRNSSNRILIYGGSFNPFHKGHGEVVEKALEAIDGAECLAYITLKHSQNKKIVGPSAAERLYALLLEQKNHPAMSVGVINEGFYRNFLHMLAEFHPNEDNEYLSAIGIDILPQIVNNNRHEMQKIFSINWIVATRNGQSLKEFITPEIEPYIKKMQQIDISEAVQHVSSSGIRDLLNAKDPKIRDYISPEYLEFIKRRGVRYV